MITILTTYQVSDTWYIRTWYQVYIYRTRVYDSRYVLTRYVRGINERIGILYNSQQCTTSGAHACIAVQDYTAVDKNVKGRRWWTALGLGRAVPGRPIFHLVGRGPARPNFQRMGRGPAQPITCSFFHGPARPMTLAARPMRHELCTGRPTIFVGRPVDLTGRATGGPMSSPVLKGEGICADVLFLLHQWVPQAQSTEHNVLEGKTGQIGMSRIYCCKSCILPTRTDKSNVKVRALVWAV